MGIQEQMAEREKRLLKRARAMALEYVNKGRTEDGLPPINRITSLWWSLYKAEWLVKAQAEEKANIKNIGL